MDNRKYLSRQEQIKNLTILFRNSLQNKFSLENLVKTYYKFHIPLIFGCIITSLSFVVITTDLVSYFKKFLNSKLLYIIGALGIALLISGILLVILKSYIKKVIVNHIQQNVTKWCEKVAKDTIMDQREFFYTIEAKIIHSENDVEETEQEYLIVESDSKYYLLSSSTQTIKNDTAYIDIEGVLHNYNGPSKYAEEVRRLFEDEGEGKKIIEKARTIQHRLNLRKDYIENDERYELFYTDDNIRLTKIYNSNSHIEKTIYDCEKGVHTPKEIEEKAQTHPFTRKIEIPMHDLECGSNPIKKLIKKFVKTKTLTFELDDIKSTEELRNKINTPLSAS